MNKVGTMFVCALLAACAGKSQKGTSEPARAAAEPMPATEAAPEPAPPEEPTAETAAETAEEAATLAAQATPAAPEAAPAPALIARAELASVKDGSPMGTVTFERNPEGKIVITGSFSGLKEKGVHAFYIHEKGDCSNKARNVGGHLNPTQAKHGPPASSERHAGDFGNLTADEAGNAFFSMETDSVTMEGDRPDSILNRAVVIHAKKDDKKGNGGAALACGVITLVEP
jgi:Cu-Zn family superoxide dismutase